MSRRLSNKRLVILLITPLLFSSACNASSGVTPTGPQPENTTIGITPTGSQLENMTLHRDVVYGSGQFNLPDAKAGLSDLSSYKATLTLAFDGTRNGQSEKWSETYLMLRQTAPVAR